MYNKNVSERWLKAPMQWNILDTVAFLAMTALALGAFLALLVVIPRMPGSRRGFLFGRQSPSTSLAATTRMISGCYPAPV